MDMKTFSTGSVTVQYRFSTGSVPVVFSLLMMSLITTRSHTCEKKKIRTSHCEKNHSTNMLL